MTMSLLRVVALSVVTGFLAPPAFADAITIEAGKTGSIQTGGRILTVTNLGDQLGSATISCGPDRIAKFRLAPSTVPGSRQAVDAGTEALCSIKAGPTKITVSNQ
jgi:hypothetical protein